MFEDGTDFDGVESNNKDNDIVVEEGITNDNNTGQINGVDIEAGYKLEREIMEINDKVKPNKTLYDEPNISGGNLRRLDLSADFRRVTHLTWSQFVLVRQ